MMSKIEKSIAIKASIEKVWEALRDYRQFGQWFRVKVESPFEEGKISEGYMTYPGYEHIRWKIKIEKIEPKNYFVFSWHPFAVEPNKDYTNESPTLIEFRLKEIPGATLLTIEESGFDKLPKERFKKAFEMNDKGWDEQLKNISNYVS